MGNFGAVLFIEKEGFSELLKAAKIAERFDVALMSTKGMSVVAARALADEMYHDHDIPLLLLHDFDKSGFSIASARHAVVRISKQHQDHRYRSESGGRYRNGTGKRIPAPSQGRQSRADRQSLDNGATDEEIEFMFQDFDRLRSTRRVELNAMTSPDFISFIERKLPEHGITWCWTLSPIGPPRFVGIGSTRLARFRTLAGESGVAVTRVQTQLIQ
jgi:hypothetical protein